MEILNNYNLLNQIKSPNDVKKIDNLNILCEEIRSKIIEIVSKNGGHLASNLGVVELTVALFSVFDFDHDKIVWDVGHQCYAHKMLTGRFNKINNIRTENNISGFTNKLESKYDIFTSGHSSTSISSALGLARARDIISENNQQKITDHVICVIGDGALTGGLAYEGLNNCANCKNFTVILNDNKMSISSNVGAIARYLSNARLKPYYIKTRNLLEKVLETTNFGTKIEKILRKSKYVIKSMFYKSSIFEDMGFVYYGPINGHDINQLQKVFDLVKNIDQPSLVHVITNKGKGYDFAERDPKNSHVVGPFDLNIGFNNKNKVNNKLSFSEAFGNKLCELAENNKKICAITAAMTSSTGLSKFKQKFKSRFFDVGIAEGHAITFAGGLAAMGLIPVVAIYSSFLQRAYDQIIHDVAMQNSKIILAIDRAGLTGEDGEAHQGIYDVNFLSTIPNIKIYSPSFLSELGNILENAINSEENKIFAIRYPKSTELYKPDNYKFNNQDYNFFSNNNINNNTSKILVITYGRIFSEVWLSKIELEKLGIYISILKLNKIFPININSVKLSCNFDKIIFFEETINSGSISEKFGDLLLKTNNFHGKYINYNITDNFVPHARMTSQIKKYMFNSENIITQIKNINNL